MRTHRGAHIGDELNTAGDRRRETDAVVRSENVIVHGFWNGHHREAFFVQAHTKTEGIVAADGNHHINAQVAEHVQAVFGVVNRAVIPRFSPF